MASCQCKTIVDVIKILAPFAIWEWKILFSKICHDSGKWYYAVGEVVSGKTEK